MRMISKKPLSRQVAEYLVWPNLVTPAAKYLYLVQNAVEKSKNYPGYKVRSLPCDPKSKNFIIVCI